MWGGGGGRSKLVNKRIFLGWCYLSKSFKMIEIWSLIFYYNYSKYKKGIKSLHYFMQLLSKLYY